ncbi:MAG: DegT/DnrJ/EryC1/StrS family aminotransferase [Deltaproteobacteria bacterium]|nr:DegT/DnrJ/EryC1/StrS family aminotransferase [Deltaproteobacteria bacterium]
MSAPVPFLDLPQQHRPLLNELNQVIGGLIAEGKFIGGAPVAEFEKAFAKFVGSAHAVGVANGTDALMLALRVLGVSRGDVVIVPAHTFIATAEAVSMVGATPRFVDIDPITYTLDPKALAAVDKTGVKAVMPVHLYGQPADMAPILATAKQHGWHVVEDCAQSHGATYQGKVTGSFGVLAGFSFYPGKNLGAFGDGGAVTGSDDARIDHLRRVADHGRQTKQLHGEPGVNSRLDAIQAAALTIKLKHLAAWNKERAVAAGWYEARLKDVKGVVTPKVGALRSHIYHIYALQVPERDRFLEHAAAQGVGCGVHYAVPLHLQPAYKALGHKQGDFKVAEQVTARCVSLPMFPGITEAQVDQVVKVVKEHVKAGS